MKTILPLLVAILAFETVSAQCPTNASAIQVTQFRFTGSVLGYNTCTVQGYNFPINSRVYIYNNAAVLVDSFTTNNVGTGYVELDTSNCLTYGSNGGNNSSALNGGGYTPPALGRAVCGICSTNIGGVVLLPLTIREFATQTSGNKTTITWQLEEEKVGTQCSLQESNDGRNFTTIHTVNSTAAAIPGQLYRFTPSASINRFYRLLVKGSDGTITYSNIEKVLLKGDTQLDIFPTVSSGNFTLRVPSNFVNGEIRIVNVSGMAVKNQSINATYSTIQINSKGLHYVKALASDGSMQSGTVTIQ